MKDFNLERALAGDPVVTRGRVKIVGLVHFPETIHDNCRVICVTKNGTLLTTYENGRITGGLGEHEHPDDLFMESGREGWVNIYPNNRCSEGIWATKQSAQNYAARDVLATVKIQWEEE